MREVLAKEEWDESWSSQDEASKGLQRAWHG